LANAIFSVLLKVIGSILTVPMAIIEGLLLSALSVAGVSKDTIDTLLSSVVNIVNIPLKNINYILDMLFIQPETFKIFVVFVFISLSLPYVVHAVKALVNWYNKLKL